MNHDSMTRMMLLAVALSWDSLIVGVVDGSFRISGASKLRMASLFALCDGTAVAVGLSFGGAGSLPGQISDAATLAAWLILVLLVVGHLAWNSGRNRQWVVPLLPLLFCVDNLAAGPEFASLGAGPVASFGLAGAVSGLFFLAGSTCGQCAAAQLRRLRLVGATGGGVPTTIDSSAASGMKRPESASRIHE